MDQRRTPPHPLLPPFLLLFYPQSTYMRPASTQNHTFTPLMEAVDTNSCRPFPQALTKPAPPDAGGHPGWPGGDVPASPTALPRVRAGG